MKRFLLFASADYYPDGGWKDFVDSFDDLAAAKAAGDNPSQLRDWWHIVDSKKGTIVYECQITPSGKREVDGGARVRPEADHRRANHHYVLDDTGRPCREQDKARGGVGQGGK